MANITDSLKDIGKDLENSDFIAFWYPILAYMSRKSESPTDL